MSSKHRSPSDMFGELDTYKENPKTLEGKLLDISVYSKEKKNIKYSVKHQDNSIHNIKDKTMNIFFYSTNIWRNVYFSLLKSFDENVSFIFLNSAFAIMQPSWFQSSLRMNNEKHRVLKSTTKRSVMTLTPNKDLFLHTFTKNSDDFVWMIQKQKHI